MAVNPLVPAKTVPEFIAYAKANPGKLNMASAGIGGATHVFGELFMMMAGVSLLHVPYRDNFILDLLGGQVQVVVAPITHLIEYIRTGKLRALAITSATRSAALPDIPTMAEFVSGYEASGWYGIGAPNTPAEIIDRLNKEINAALADPKMKARAIVRTRLILFTTTIGCLICSDSRSPSERAIRSIVPPGGCGSANLIGRA